MDDGSDLLTGPDVGPLLEAAISHQGGTLESWRLDHVDTNPDQSTTATYVATVAWAYGERSELLGVSARSGELSGSDGNAEIFADGQRQVAVWLYPYDPDLPGLPRAAFPQQLALALTETGVVGRAVAADEIDVTMIGYRPRRRAVVRASLAGGEVFYIKVLRPRVFDDVLGKHRLLCGAGVPAPEVALATPDQLLVTRELPGRSLAKALFAQGDPCTAEQLIQVLDSMPAAVAQLERRAPWSDAVSHYSHMVARALPTVSRDLDWAVHHISQGLAAYPLGNEPTHGDFHEGQLRVGAGRILGILDIDTIGPGRRADDLACLIAHLSTIQRMNSEQSAKVRDLLRR
ncbi:MAG: phosphotransferase, partial [Arachnia sp.]